MWRRKCLRRQIFEDRALFDGFKSGPTLFRCLFQQVTRQVSYNQAAYRLGRDEVGDILSTLRSSIFPCETPALKAAFTWSRVLPAVLSTTRASATAEQNAAESCICAVYARLGPW